MVEFKSNFNFDDEVEINPLDCKGRIVSFWLRQGNILMIEVRYFINNELKTEYFYENELEIAKEMKAGF